MGLKTRFKASFSDDALFYNLLAVGYGVATLSRSRLRAAFRRLFRSGVFYREEELYMCSLLPQTLLDVVLAELKPRSLLDVGCGIGRTLVYLTERGVDALGVEASKLAIARSPMADRIVRADLRRPIDLGRHFDVVWSYEVAEHIHARFTDVFLQTLARHGDRIVMSAARPGQPGEGHFNLQPPEYWIERMARWSFQLDTALTARLRATPDQFAQNMMAFARFVAAK